MFGDKGLEVVLHPFPDVGKVIDDVLAGGFREETVVWCHEDGGVGNGVVNVPLGEIGGGQARPGELFICE